MKYCASHRFVRIAARKARYVIDLVRCKPVNQALEILRCTPKRAAYFIQKVLDSAIANAKQADADIDINNLIIVEARVDGGPMLKRFRPGPMGRAMRIRRRLSHINLALDVRPTSDATAKKKVAKQPKKTDKPAATPETAKAPEAPKADTKQ